MSFIYNFIFEEEFISLGDEEYFKKSIQISLYFLFQLDILLITLFQHQNQLG